MKASHAVGAVSARFDDRNLVAYGGLVPVWRLAERCGLLPLVTGLIVIGKARNGAGSNAASKVATLVMGMVCGADSIDDMDRLRHGAMDRLFGGVRAPSTLGTFLRAFTHGHVRQLHAVHRRFLAALVAHTPVLPEAARFAYLDVDDTIRATHGYAKQGAGYGYSKVKGLNALVAIVSTPTCAPLVAATRLRKGACSSVRGFVPQPKRWVVEQTYGTMSLHRRLVRDYEHDPASSESRVYWAMTDIMSRRLTGTSTLTWRSPRSAT